MNIVGQHMLESDAEDRQERLDRYKRAWEAYRGELPDALKVRAGKPNDNIKVNYAKLVVNLGVTFLFGKDVRFELTETANTAAEQWLRRAWKRNKKLTLLQKWGMNGGVCGTAFLKLSPAKPFPRVINLDPATVDVCWDDEDIEQATSWCLGWTRIDRSSGQPRPKMRRQRIERLTDAAWEIVDEQKAFGGRWETLAVSPWPYAWAPIIFAQNLPAANEFHGTADLEDDIIGLNRSLNFILSNLNRIIRFHAHPKTWGKGFQAKELQVAVDETLVLPNKDAELHNLEMQGDLGSSIELYKQVREALHAISQTPEVASGRVENVGQLSALALKVLYGPLVGKTETKRQTYGDALAEANSRLLELGGFGPDLETTLHWPEMIPADELAARNVLLLDKQLGVSEDTLLQKAGYDPDVEREKRKQNAQTAGSALLSAFDRGETADPADGEDDEGDDGAA